MSDNEDLEQKIEKKKQRRRRRKKKQKDDSDGGGSSSEDEDAKRKRRRARRRKQKEESKNDADDDDDENNNPGGDDDNKSKRRKKRSSKNKNKKDTEEDNTDNNEGGEEENSNSKSKRRKKRNRNKKKKGNNDDKGEDDDDDDDDVEEDDNIARMRTKVIEIQRREFDPAQYNFEIDEEDLMDGPILPFSGRSHFIRLNVPPPETTITGTQDYALTREQQNIQKSDGSGKPTYVYVESATSGRFRRVRMGRLGYRQLGMNDDDDDDLNETFNGPEVMTHFTDNVNAFTATVYGFAQGLLAGFALLHVYIANMFDDRNRFIEVYWPLAGESRRLFFFLTTIALTSAYDLYLRESSKRDLWQVLPNAKKFRVYLILFLYFIALLTSLLAMPIDNSIAKLGMNGMNSSPLLNDAAITQWNLYEWIRGVSCVLAWVFVCFGIHDENQNGRRFMSHCKYLKGEIEKKQRRLDNVSGKQLQYATPDELEELLTIQKSAAEATERAIEYYRKRSVNR